MRLNDLDFHVEVEGDGPPLLLLHGFTGSTRSWDDVRQVFTERATLVAVDLIGHGRSMSPVQSERYTLEWSACDLAVLLDTLGFETADVLGYSMGGRVALHFAVHHPQRVNVLILESASPGIESDEERQRRALADNALAERILRDGMDAFVDEWERQPLLGLRPHVAEAVRAKQHSQRLLNHPLGLANSLRGMGTGQMTTLWSRLSDLRVPVQLIVGEYDMRYRAIAQDMRAMLPLSDLAVVPDAGHTVHIDQPRQFAFLVENAIDQQIDTTRHTLLD